MRGVATLPGIRHNEGTDERTREVVVAREKEKERVEAAKKLTNSRRRRRRGNGRCNIHRPNEVELFSELARRFSREAPLVHGS